MATVKIGDMTLYDVEALEELLGIQARTIRKYLREGKLKGRKMAKKWYVTEDALQEYFEQGEPELEQEPAQEASRKLPEQEPG